MGETFFAPATMNTTSNAGFVAGAIMVAIDTTITYSGGQANWYWNSRDEIQAAQIQFKSEAALMSGPVAKHEFLHALGLHHTCQWLSVMGGYGCPMSDLTLQDVGYAKAAWHVRDGEAPLRTSAGDLPSNVLSLGAIAEGEIVRKKSLNLMVFADDVSRSMGTLTPPSATRPINPSSLPNYSGGDSAH
jgi:hypothetical protein